MRKADINPGVILILISLYTRGMQSSLPICCVDPTLSSGFQTNLMKKTTIYEYRELSTWWSWNTFFLFSVLHKVCSLSMTMRFEQSLCTVNTAGLGTSHNVLYGWDQQSGAATSLINRLILVNCVFFLQYETYIILTLNYNKFSIKN